MMGLVGATLNRKGLPSKFFKQVIVGSLFIKILGDISANVTDANGWENLLQGMRCPYNLK